MLTRRVAGRIYNYDYCIGRASDAGTSFRMPLDFALGSDRSIYVVNRGQEFRPGQGITKCTLDQDLVWEDRGLGYAGGESPWPSSLDLDREENVYVCDEYVNRVFTYRKDGRLLGSWGESGSGQGEFSRPSGLAFDREDNLYVVDSLNHRVQVFTREGRFLRGWGGHGSAPGKFNMPWGIAVGRDGYVYVADWKNDRIQKLTPEGEHVASFGTPGTGEGELQRPTGTAIDAEGDVYVADWGNSRLNVYASDGAFITQFDGDADGLSRWSQNLVDANPDYQRARQRADLTPERRFYKPVAVNVDDDGRIMVLESNRGRIQIYVKERNFVDAQFNL